MDDYCHQCGEEIAGEGVAYQGRLFCSDDCCDEFEAALSENAEPGDLELSDDLQDDDLDDDLGYRNGDDDDDDDDFLDDDYAIDPEDF